MPFIVHDRYVPSPLQKSDLPSAGPSVQIQSPSDRPQAVFVKDPSRGLSALEQGFSYTIARGGRLENGSLPLAEIQKLARLGRYEKVSAALEETDLSDEQDERLLYRAAINDVENLLKWCERTSPKEVDFGAVEYSLGEARKLAEKYDIPFNERRAKRILKATLKYELRTAKREAQRNTEAGVADPAEYFIEHVRLVTKRLRDEFGEQRVFDEERAKKMLDKARRRDLERTFRKAEKEAAEEDDAAQCEQWCMWAQSLRSARALADQLDIEFDEERAQRILKLAWKNLGAKNKKRDIYSHTGAGIPMPQSGIYEACPGCGQWNMNGDGTITPRR